VKLLPRKNAADEAPEPADEAGDEQLVRGKGRPTPKRRDTVGVRGPVSAPKTRKEAYARQKQLAKQSRTARSGPPQTAAERRAALRSGQVLSRRDQGDTRALARDYVDSRRFLLSNYLLLVIVLMLLAMIGFWILQLIAFAVFLGCLVEWYAIGGKIRKMAIERYGRADGGALTIGFYAGSRAYLPRRWRIPVPRVDKGDTI
jgi:hypothetical protein